MTTDTEALRDSFEWTVLNTLKWNKRDLDRNRAGDYENEDVRAMWLCFQAGHAAGVAAERERCASVCDRCASALDYSGNAYVRSRECQQAADAIRAGAKEAGS